MREQGGLPGRGALAGGAWKMRGDCAAFPRRILSSLLPHCLPRAHIFPEKCFNPTPPGTWLPSPHPLLLLLLLLSASKSVSPKPGLLTAPQLGPPSAPRRGTCNCSVGHAGSRRPTAAALVLGRQCHQSPLSSSASAGPSPGLLLPPNVARSFASLSWAAWDPPLGTVCHPSTPPLWAVIPCVWLPLSILCGL